MNSNITTYSVNYVYSVPAAGGTDQARHQIIETGRRFNLLSVMWSLLIYDTADFVPLPLAQNNLVNINMQIDNPLGTLITKQPKALAGAGASSFLVAFVQPGIYRFTNLTFYEQLIFTANFKNTHATEALTVVHNLLIEIEFIDV
jgi:hypothetical protein